MAFEMEEVKSSGSNTGGFLNKLKSKLTKKNVLIFGGIGVVLFLIIRRSSAAGSGSVDDTAGELMYSGYPIAPESATSTENATDTEAKFTEMMDQFQSIMDQRITDVQNETLEAAAQMTQQEVASVQASANQQIAAAGAASQAAINNYQKNVETTIRQQTESLTKQNAALNTQIKAGYGDNGAGWTAQGEKELNSKLSTDSAFKNSEIERAKAVYENRKAAGMDTSLQEKYIKQLTTTGQVG